MDQRVGGCSDCGRLSGGCVRTVAVEGRVHTGVVVGHVGDRRHLVAKSRGFPWLPAAPQNWDQCRHVVVREGCVSKWGAEGCVRYLPPCKWQMMHKTPSLCRRAEVPWILHMTTLSPKQIQNPLPVCNLVHPWWWGGGGVFGALASPPTHPHQKKFPQAKNEIYQRGRKFEVNFRYTNLFLASDPPTHPPPPPGAGGFAHQAIACCGVTAVYSKIAFK